MHFSTLLLLLPSLAYTATLPARQLLPTGQTIKQDVLNIHNAVLGLDATVQSFTGGTLPTSLITGAPILLGVADIHVVNRAGFRHALVATPFSVGDSVDVIDAVVSTVNISIPASLEHLKAKAGAFKEGGLTITVIASLKLLLFDHDSFSEAVLAKVDPGIGEEKTREGEAAVKNIHDSIQAGIVFFEGDLV